METNVSNANNVITQLQNEASSNELFKTVCQLFLGRERTRHEVTLATLQRLVENQTREVYSKKDYEKVLLKFSELGIGMIRRNIKGDIIALSKIKVTLQSVGRIALGEKVNLASTNNKIKNVYRDLESTAPLTFKEAIKHKLEAIKEEPPKAPTAEKRPYRVFLLVLAGNEPLIFQGASDLREDDFWSLMYFFNAVSSKQEVKT